MTMWSPGRSSTRSRTSEAPMPEPNAKPCRPPSSAARHSCRAVRVGFAEREYSYPPRSPPTPSWAKVELAWIGTITAPVVGSGSWPAWMARVEKPRMAARLRGPGHPHPHQDRPVVRARDVHDVVSGRAGLAGHEHVVDPDAGPA